MRYLPIFLAAMILASGFVLARAEDKPAPAAVTATKFSDADKAAIEEIVKNYLVNEHPEIIMEAAQKVQQRDMETATNKSEEEIAKLKEKILNDPNTPSSGDPKGDVTIVEFYDYQCGYCKMAEAAAEKILKEDKKIRFIYKDYPILGPESLEAAKASLAAMRQGKFVKFHDALMNSKEHISDSVIADAAKQAGLDLDKLKKDAADPAIQKMVEDNLQLGQDIGVRGTPMFIINGQVFPGALQYDQMKKAIQDARKGDNNKGDKKS